jgi:hypothetical protein
MLIQDFSPAPTFLFRELELARIARVTMQGQSVLLVGIRNTGKTQLMRAALTAHKQASARHEAAMLDVQTLDTLNAFYALLLRAIPQPLLLKTLDSAKSLPQAVMGWIRSQIDKVSVAGVSVDLNAPQQLSHYWVPLQTALEQVLAQHARDGKTEELPLLGIDELPFMLLNMLNRNVAVADITVLLASLRSLRAAGLRMILGGSISMDNILTLNNIPTTVLSGLWREEVPPFTPKEARALLELQLSGRAAAAHISTILEHLPDHVPAHLETAANVLAVAEVRNAADVAWLMRHEVMKRIRGAFLQQFEERLSSHFDDDQRRVAEALLDQVAQHGPEGGPINTVGMPPVWRRVLTMLQADMYLRDAPDLGLRFSLQIVRLWWRAQRGMA